MKVNNIYIAKLALFFMRPIFPITSSHLDLAHATWKKLLMQGDIAVDATVGNGKDTLVLCNLLQQAGGGALMGLDIQSSAISATENLIKKNGPFCCVQIDFFCISHDHFPPVIEPQSVKLFVYNLGYLPGGDKKITTKTQTTLASLHQCLPLLTFGGVISITCYVGHDEGKIEFEAIDHYTRQLSSDHYCVVSHHFTNRNQSPILILIQKKFP